MNFAELLDSKITESIPYRDKKINVTYTPEKVTREDWGAFEDDTLSRSEKEEIIYKILEKAIDSWSITDLPPTSETFARSDFPDVLLTAIIDRLLHIRKSAAGKFKVLAN